MFKKYFGIDIDVEDEDDILNKIAITKKTVLLINLIFVFVLFSVSQEDEDRNEKLESNFEIMEDKFDDAFEEEENQQMTLRFILTKANIGWQTNVMASGGGSNGTPQRKHDPKRTTTIIDSFLKKGIPDTKKDYANSSGSDVLII